MCKGGLSPSSVLPPTISLIPCVCQVVSLIPYIEPLELELLIIEPAKTLDLQLRIDHATQTFIFGSTIQYQREETTRSVTLTLGRKCNMTLISLIVCRKYSILLNFYLYLPCIFSLTTIPLSGPTVQQMPSEMFRNQLVSLYGALNKSVDLISPTMKMVSLLASVVNYFRVNYLMCYIKFYEQ